MIITLCFAGCRMCARLIRLTIPTMQSVHCGVLHPRPSTPASSNLSCTCNLSNITQLKHNLHNTGRCLVSSSTWVWLALTSTVSSVCLLGCCINFLPTLFSRDICWERAWFCQINKMKKEVTIQTFQWTVMTDLWLRRMKRRMMQCNFIYPQLHSLLFGEHVSWDSVSQKHSRCSLIKYKKTAKSSLLQHSFISTLVIYDVGDTIPCRTTYSPQGLKVEEIFFTFLFSQEQQPLIKGSASQSLTTLDNRGVFFNHSSSFFLIFFSISGKYFSLEVKPCEVNSSRRFL